MAEGGGLLNRYTETIRIVGSNPIPSASASCVTEMSLNGRATPERANRQTGNTATPISKNADKVLTRRRGFTTF